MSTLDPRLEEDRRSAWPSDLIDTVYEAAADSAHWPRWFDALSTSLGRRASNLVIHGFGATRYVSLDTPGSSFDTLNPTQVFVHKALSRRCFAIGYAGGEITEDATHFIHEGASATAIQLFTDEQRALEPSDFDLLRVVLPHLHRALVLHFRLDQFKRQQDSLGACLDNFFMGMMLVDTRTNVLHANRSAVDYLRSTPDIEWDVGPLTVRDPGADATLKRNVKAATVGGERTMRGQRLSDVVTVWIRGLSPDQAVLFISNEEDERSLTPELLRDAFDLSAAEARVASLVAAGASVDEISAQLGKAVGTVRSQVKAIQAKTGTSRHAALVRLMLESIPPVHL